MNSRPSTMGATTGFCALARHVRSLERSIDFYVRGLGFAVEQRQSGGPLPADVMLTLGEERIALYAMQNIEDEVPRVLGPDVRFQHAAIVTGDMTTAFQRLQVLAPDPITSGGPQRLPEASGGATAFKFRDPDGHPLELIEFAATQCPDRWRSRLGNHKTFGIDHAAISVSQVEKSIGFYRGFGFSVQTRQTNCGVEQARLDGIELDDVEVEVVALVPGGSPGVHLELLAYRNPISIGGPAGDKSLVAGATDLLVWLGAPPRTFFADQDGHRHGLLLPPP